jgi:hypothetical protein
MKAKERSLGNWIIRRFRAAPAQSMVEFAMALPVLLLATFGVIEFGRLLQAWLALENGARFGARYAITGEFNKAYCAQADAALGLTTEDGNADCKVEVPNTATDAQKDEARDRTQALQDWARMPSIRDAALAGASGIALDESASVSGDYLQYLVDARTHGTTFSPDYRGNPSKPGFFMISICSNRVGPALTGVTPPTFPVFLINDPALDATLARYYTGHDGESDYQYFPTLCMAYNKTQTGPTSYTTTPQYYMDDAGGPGDRVRITLTYRHQMIMPLLSDWWPTLRLNTSRDGVVEKFRTSRVTGLSEGNMNPDTPTFTNTQTKTYTISPTITETPTVTLTPTNTQTYTPTNTNTVTPTDTVTKTYTVTTTWTPTRTWTITRTPTVTSTSTATLVPCPSTGNGLRAEYYNWVGGAPAFTSPIFSNIATTVNFDWGYGSPGTGVGSENFNVRFVGEVMPLASEKYTFYISTDDGGRLWVNNVALVTDGWTDQSETERSGSITLTRCQRYPILFEMYENTGGAVARLRWSSNSQSYEIIPRVNLFGTLTGAPATATITPIPPTETRTPTRTPRPTKTNTPTYTITRTPTVSRTPTVTDTPTRTNTNTPTKTETPIPPATNTKTITPTAPTKTYTVTNTPKGIGG